TKMSERKLHPTGLHPKSLAAEVLDFMMEGKLGLAGLAAAADVVAADCRYNYRSAIRKYGPRSTEVKQEPAWSDEREMRELEEGEANIERCHAAMAAFQTGGSCDDLCRELAAVANFLNGRT